MAVSLPFAGPSFVAERFCCHLASKFLLHFMRYPMLSYLLIWPPQHLFLGWTTTITDANMHEILFIEPILGNPCLDEHTKASQTLTTGFFPNDHIGNFLYNLRIRYKIIVLWFSRNGLTHLPPYFFI